MDTSTQEKQGKTKNLGKIMGVIVFIVMFIFIGIPLLQNEFTSTVWQSPSEDMIYEYDGVFKIAGNNGEALYGASSITLSPDRKLTFSGYAGNESGENSVLLFV